MEGKRDPSWRAPMPLTNLPIVPDVRIIAFYCDISADVAQRADAARPQFVRHIQPVTPLLPQTLPGPQAVRADLSLAHDYGVDAFCFWVPSAGALPSALRELLSDQSLPIGISLFFDGPLPDVRSDVLEALADPRVLKVGGCPVLGARGGGSAREWQAAARSLLGTSLFLIQPFTGSDRLGEGFSAAVQIAPEGAEPAPTPRRIEPVSPAFSGHVDEFSFIARAALEEVREAKVPLFAGVCAGFDDTPRRGTAARVMVSPDIGDDYANWLAESATFADANPVAGAKFVFVNAWNDWLNGAHLVPDNRYGHALLRATATMRAPYTLLSSRPRAPVVVPPAPVRRGSVAYVVHGYYPDLLPGLIAGLTPGDLFVTTPPEKADAVRAVLARLAPGARLRIVENRGRDVRPFLSLLPELEAQGYELVLKVHTKRSPHQGKHGGDWLEQISGPLMDLARAGRLAAAFEAHPRLGLLGARGHVLDGDLYAGCAANKAWMRQLASALDVDAGLRPPYVAGTMFAARLDIFAPLRGTPYILDLFEEDMGLKDGTLAHAFERFFGVLTVAAGETVGDVEPSGAVAPAADVVTGGYFFARSGPEDDLVRLQHLAAAR